MALRELKITDFRCIEAASLTLDADYTLIVGENGAGKTSILEAIYCLSRGRSFRKTRTDRLVRHGQPHFIVFAKVARREVVHRLGLKGGKGSTEARLDGAKADSLAGLAATLAVEIIDPEIHGLIGDGPEERRRFLDFGVFHVKHDFLGDWRTYRRALRQRNSALKAGRPWSELEVWDEALIGSVARVDSARRSYAERLAGGFEEIGSRLLGAAHLRCVYRSGWQEGIGFREALGAARERDREQATTTVGPHRADLRIEYGGRLARQQVSRGQQKLVAASLILAQTRDIAAVTGQTPLLLLDDPAAELDKVSLARLMAEVADCRCQLIVTALDTTSVAFTKPPAVFHVKQGVVTPS